MNTSEKKGLVRGLVEEGVRRIIDDEVRTVLAEMFPPVGRENSGPGGYFRNSMRREIQTLSQEAIQKDPEIRELVKAEVVRFVVEEMKKGRLAES